MTFKGAGNMEELDRSLFKEENVRNGAGRLFGSYEYRYGPGEHVVDAHWHNEMEWFYVAEGEVRFQVGVDTLVLQAGEAAFVDAGELHAGHASGSAGCSFYALVFDPALLSGAVYDAIEEKLIQPLRDRSATFPRRAMPDAGLGSSLLEELAAIRKACREQQPGYEAEVKGRLLLMLAVLHADGEAADRRIRHEGARPPEGDALKVERLKRVIEFIRVHYGQPIRIAELAALIPLSEGQFIRFFRGMTGQTPIGYIKAYRIRQAALLLRETDRRIADIALETGFDNVSYFIRSFQAAMKSTPSDFRRRRDPAR